MNFQVRFQTILNNMATKKTTATAPKELIAQDKKDLKEKLEEGIKDSESGNVYSIDEVFDEVEKILKK